jgi:hypothetical protein
MKQGTLRKHEVKQDFFDVVDTEDKAYWLGFLMADGCVTGNKLVLRLKKSDEEHIQKFLTSIGANHPIKSVWTIMRGKRFESSYVNIYSKYMVRSLATHGLFPRKSCKEIVWQGPDDLQRYFFRGVFDGDGSLSVFSTKSSPNPQWRLCLCGSQEMVSGFANYVEKHAGHKPPKIMSKNRLFTISYGGIGKPRDIAALLYTDRGPYLERKKYLADRLKNEEGYSTKQLDKDTLEEMYSKFGTWKDVAVHLNMDLKTFYRRRKGMGLMKKA